MQRTLLSPVLVLTKLVVASLLVTLCELLEGVTLSDSLGDVQPRIVAESNASVSTIMRWSGFMAMSTSAARAHDP